MHKLSAPGRILNRIGLWFLQSHVGQLFALLFLSLRSLFYESGNRRIDMQQIISQVYNMGIKSLPLILMVGTVLGTVLIINTAGLVLRVGFGSSFGDLMVIAVVRELGPVLTGFLIAGRSGSSLTARIANMNVNTEIDALQTLGISHIRFLVMPALIGGIIAMLIANCFFCLSAMGAGFLMVKMAIVFLEGFFNAQLEWGSYSSSILAALTPFDFAMGIVKPLVFASIITANACYYGIHIRNDHRAVPTAISQSVVNSFILIVISDLLLSSIYILEYMNSVSSVI